MKKLLITPLDWGLGHATRCIPIIREWKAMGNEVMIAGSGDSLELLRQEFPTLLFESLPGYSPRYSKMSPMVWSMAFQLAQFARVIKAEHKAVEALVKKYEIDLIISDNRYGCWSESIPSFFITHQINILMPKRFGWLQRLVRWVNNRMIRNFDACWIPDFPGGDSLAGNLTSFGKNTLEVKTEYIGWLSRFTASPEQQTKFDVALILSGPEPQRTALENIMVPELQQSGLRYRVVRGLPSSQTGVRDPCIINFLGTNELQELIEATDLIIARSGYSTIMDLHALGKKAVFIPTPGQTEQEYLASQMMQKGIAFSMAQDKFSLAFAMDQTTRFSGFGRMERNIRLSDVVTRYGRLKKK